MKKNESTISKGAYAGETKMAALGDIYVTKSIIEEALPAHSSHCMASDAVSRAAKLKGMKINRVLTDLQTIRFTDLKQRKRYICFTPRSVQEALLKFDRGIRPEPFVFRLRAAQIIPMRTTQKKISNKPYIAQAISKKSQKRPILHGGKALPTMVGLRREFGLRKMGVYKSPDESEKHGVVETVSIHDGVIE